jgi:Flp pilus assembly protein CpaB
MKGGSKLFLIAGAGLAVVAIALLVTGMSGGGKADAKKDGNSTKVTVVEAVVDIPTHTLLTPEDLLEVQVPQAEAAPDAVHAKTDVVGLSYRVPLVKGQRLLTSQTEQPGLRNDIKVGMRALSLPVNEVSLLSGLVQDGDYVDVVFHARINPVRILPSNVAYTPEDLPYYKFDEKTIVFLPPDVEAPQHPFTGDPGSQFAIRDDVGEAQQLEPVAKIMIQDVRVLRVVRPGETFSAGGGIADLTAVEGAPAQTDQTGHLILEVTPEQAEVLTFMQDKRHEYQVIVRGKDDHGQAKTAGITFQILATDADWALPWPKSLTAPKEQAKAAPKSQGESGQSGQSGTATPTAEDQVNS